MARRLPSNGSSTCAAGLAGVAGVAGRLILRDQDQRLQLMGIEPVSLPVDSAVAGQAMPIERIVAFFSPPGSTWISPRPCRPWA
jgi:hypothetical protein